MALINDRVRHLKSTLPPHIELVAAAKTRSAAEVRSAIEAGICVIGHNYVQEAQSMIENVGREAATWTFIGHLQRNKVKLAVQLFDGVQTVDSIRLAEAIDRECHKIGRIMPILIEINAAREPQKSGVAPEDAEDMIRALSKLKSIHIEGLMTMGPFVSDPEDLRPIFRATKALFDRLAGTDIPRVSMAVLSMGMSASYKIAIEEGATMIRLGTTIFGPRA
ncbi:YggS family pyridoxal phosphate-dependent enzyme [Candidatus Bipolaricaulota bacterium]|nr:YggS family pyridoxal phosphate-dependent enzyme [Candidatus Bipolaricaulota bacterium]